jgi:hypothetical protein
MLIPLSPRIEKRLKLSQSRRSGKACSMEASNSRSPLGALHHMGALKWHDELLKYQPINVHAH